MFTDQLKQIKAYKIGFTHSLPPKIAQHHISQLNPLSELNMNYPSESFDFITPCTSI